MSVAPGHTPHVYAACKSHVAAFDQLQLCEGSRGNATDAVVV